MNRFFLHCILLCVFNTSANELVLHKAGTNRNTIINGKLVSELIENVEFEYDNARINGDRAIWYRADGKIVFSGNVEVNMKNQKLSCEKMELNKDSKTLTADRNVVFFDTKEKTKFNAARAVYEFDGKNLILTGKPFMERYDTLANDTLTISGRKMFYKDSIKTAFVENDVVITKGPLNAKCSKAEYLSDSGFAKLRIKPQIFYDIHELIGDSVDLYFVNNILSNVIVMRNGVALYKDVTSVDTVFTKMNADSISLMIKPSGGIDTIKTYTNASTIYYSSKTPSLVNRVDGKRMVFGLCDDKTGNLVVKGNAESIYYVEDDKNTGVNKASGDEILIHFTGGKASYLKLVGGSRGVYAGENL